MKIIFKIAKNELRNLVYSPVAWFLAIALFVQCAIFYTSAMAEYAHIADTMAPYMGPFRFMIRDSSYTRSIFMGGDSIFNSVMQNLYLFIPLLTMGLLGREVNNGTIKLLYSSPVKLRAIVLGKYLAMVIYNVVLISVVGIFVVLGCFNIKSIDIGVVLSAELGFFLMVCAYAAFGLFMSSLTTYQIVSGIGTFLVIFIFARIGALWQRYDFIRDLTWFLSMNGRVGRMASGLIATRDVLYFLIMITMFISFTLFKLKGEKEAKPWPVKAARYITVVVVSVLIGYVFSRPGMIGYWDTTANNVMTIDVRLQKMLKEMGKEPLEVTLYTNLLGGHAGQGFPEGRNPYLESLWEPYLRFKPDITFKYVYYYDDDGRLNDKQIYKVFTNKTEKEIAGIQADLQGQDVSMFMGPDEIRKIIDPYAEHAQLFLAVKYKGHVAHLRTFDDPQFWPNQAEVGAAFKQIMTGSNPKVFYLMGNLERNIYITGERGYEWHSTAQRVRESLINNGFSLDTGSIENRDIPADVSELVIADPKTEFSAATMGKVQRYINNGGNAIILGEPGKQGMLNPLLKSLGVQLRNGELVEVSKMETPEKVVASGTEATVDLADLRFFHQLKEAWSEKDFSDTLKSRMPSAAAIASIANSPFKVTPLFQTVRNRDWIRTERLVLDSVPPVFSPKEGDIKDSSFVTMVQLTRQLNNKQQRIIVSGDADIISNHFVDIQLATTFFSWMDYGQYPVYMDDPDTHDNHLNISGPMAYVQKIIFIWILPAALVLLAAIVLIRRKRK